MCRANAAASRNRKIHCARNRQLRLQSISPNRRGEHCSRFGAAFRFSQIDRIAGRPRNALGMCNESCSKIQRSDVRLRACRSRRSYLPPPQAEMHCLSRQKILQRRKSGSAANQKTKASHKANHRGACVCSSARADTARTIAPPLARHVDPATAANEIGKPTSDLRVDLSVHKSSGHTKGLRRTLAKDR